MPDIFLRAIRSPFRRRSVTLALAAVFTALVVWLVAVTVDPSVLATAFQAIVTHPLQLGVALAAFLAAFGARAIAWTTILSPLTFSQALAALHVSLGANHLLPFRLGEPFRVVSVIRRTSIGLRAATASTITLRAADIVALVVVGLAAGLGRFLDTWVVGPILAVGVITVIVGLMWLRRLGDDGVRAPGPVAVLLTVLAWGLESVVVFQVANWSGLAITPSEAVLVTAAAVVAQIAAIAPGGFGTYEAGGVAALAFLGHDPGAALAVVLATHAVKTAYSLVAGAIGCFVPDPGLLGRLRLARFSPQRGESPLRHPFLPPAGGVPAQPGRGESHGPIPEAGGRAPSVSAYGAATSPNVASLLGEETGRFAPGGGNGPIVLFMPAHNEEGRVGAVVHRTPATVLDREVVTLVIDDGSSDNTAAEATSAGAEVISLSPNRGLGGAVRVGLAEALGHHPAAVAFCDADGEYAPEELERLVEPIVSGRADYVVGSRFAGDIQRMLPHRRFGNRVLTMLLSWVARRRIGDGQSGYRAFSPEAAAGVDVAHDFNYAQVITLDLLQKGFRYLEVPISYSFRSSGDSFVKLGRYLRAVVPAVWRELNDRAPESASVASVLHDVGGETTPGRTPEPVVDIT